MRIPGIARTCSKKNKCDDIHPTLPRLRLSLCFTVRMGFEWSGRKFKSPK